MIDFHYQKAGNTTVMSKKLCIWLLVYLPSDVGSSEDELSVSNIPSPLA